MTAYCLEEMVLTLVCLLLSQPHGVCGTISKTCSSANEGSKTCNDECTNIYLCIQEENSYNWQQSRGCGSHESCYSNGGNDQPLCSGTESDCNGQTSTAVSTLPTTTAGSGGGGTTTELGRTTMERPVGSEDGTLEVGTTRDMGESTTPTYGIPNGSHNCSAENEEVETCNDDCTRVLRCKRNGSFYNWNEQGRCENKQSCYSNGGLDPPSCSKNESDCTGQTSAGGVTKEPTSSTMRTPTDLRGGETTTNKRAHEVTTGTMEAPNMSCSVSMKAVVDTEGGSKEGGSTEGSYTETASQGTNNVAPQTESLRRIKVRSECGPDRFRSRDCTGSLLEEITTGLTRTRCILHCHEHDECFCFIYKGDNSCLLYSG